MGLYPQGKVVYRNYHYISPVLLDSEQRKVIGDKNINKRFILFKEAFIPYKYYLAGVKLIDGKYDYNFCYTGKRYDLTQEDMANSSMSKWLEFAECQKTFLGV